MKTSLARAILCMAFSAGVVVPALAAEGFYVGGSAGRADVRDACDDLADPDVGFVGSCDDSDTGWKLFGGYQFTPHLGVEVFYADLGEVSADGTAFGVPATANAEVDGFGAAAIGRWPLAGNFALFGKLGFFRWDVESSATVDGFSDSVGDEGTDLLLGIGASYAFNERVSVRVEWERFNDIGDDDNGE